MRIILACLFVLAALPIEAATNSARSIVTAAEATQDCGTTAIRCVPSEYATIQLCANAAVAGDTCLVDIGTYDEVVTPLNSGTAGNPITYKAVTDCVSDNGATVAGSCAKVRRWLIGDDYIVVQGFEVTGLGMTSDLNRPVFVTGAANVSVLNSYIHDTNSANGCLNAGNSTNVIFGGNNITRCGLRMVAYATTLGPFNIQAGVNDQISISVQGGAAQTRTLTPGAARTSQQIGDEIQANPFTGADPCGHPTSDFCTEYFNIISTTQGLTSSIEWLAVANSAYATMGITVGMGEMYSHAPGVAGAGSVTGWLVENSVISYVSDGFNPGDGDEIVVRDTTVGPSDRYSQVHIDLMQPGAFTKVMLENVLATDSNNIQNHLLLNSNAGSDHHIYRFIRTCRYRGGTSMSGGANQLYFYNNTFYDNFAYFLGTDGSQLFLQNLATDNLARNNIWKNSRQAADGVYQVSGTGAIDHDYDMWLDTPDPNDAGTPGGANSINADPLVTDGPNCDFTLQAGSPAIDAGGPLTTVAAGDTGSGTSLVLTDARPFQDGWAGVTPDAIAVGTVGNIAQISSIDYATGEVTLASGITRNDGDPVWLYANSRGTRVLYGPAPDIGAFESNWSESPTPGRRLRRRGGE